MNLRKGFINNIYTQEDQIEHLDQENQMQKSLQNLTQVVLEKDQLIEGSQPKTLNQQDHQK